ncbi:MAG: hypothetical protein JNM00_13105, partial [Flavobacteriales bacterium]|nr:hypothetical protein [Flavobacteriales bacterium]
MRKIYLLFSVCMLFAASLFSQRNCGTTEYMHSLFEADPLYEQNIHSIEQFTQEWI